MHVENDQNQINVLLTLYNKNIFIYFCDFFFIVSSSYIDDKMARNVINIDEEIIDENEELSINKNDTILSTKLKVIED